MSIVLLMLTSLSITHYPTATDLPLRDLARAVDESPLDTLWVVDHVQQAAPGSDPTGPMLEASTMLGWLAASTSRVRLGTAVHAVTFRAPAVLIKAISTLDALSGGRAWFGIGVGGDTAEAGNMGLPLGPVRERFDLMSETLALAHQMWAGDETPFHGTHIRADRPLCYPRPINRPRIMIGGHGEKRTLPLVARYADACNIFDIPDGGATVRRKLDVLARECEAVGRDPGDVEKTIGTWLPPDQSAEQFAEHCLELGALGIDHMCVIHPGPWTEEALTRLSAAARLIA